ncbi:hypothetical protein HYU22_04880 [Candidatus Woesearchaeota archaeon]|nr:hypothetical protein [Candidatus Woesearchaeota archaeon]
MTTLVVFEGLDLSGKSTLIDLLNRRLNNSGITSRINKGALTCNNVLGVEREEQMSRYEKDLYYTFLLAQDKHIHLDNTTDVILQDRYYPSVMFYGALYSASKSLANNLPLSTFIQPELFFYLKCSFEERKRRFLKRVDNGFEDFDLLDSNEEYERRTIIFDEVMERVQNEYGNVLSIKVDNKTPGALVEEVLESIRFKL